MLSFRLIVPVWHVSTVSGISSCIATTTRLVSQKVHTLQTYHVFNQYTSAYASIRQHTSTYVRNVSIRQHASSFVSIRQFTSAHGQDTSAYGIIRQDTSAYVNIRQHTPAYVSIRSTHPKRRTQPSAQRASFRFVGFDQVLYRG